MPRPKLSRKICKAPEFRGFVPIDQKRDSIPVLIDIEEYEALRLCDNTMLGHKEAAAEMGVSRPTFTRIYESARRKVALAFVEARAIVFEGERSIMTVTGLSVKIAEPYLATLLNRAYLPLVLYVIVQISCNIQTNSHIDYNRLNIYDYNLLIIYK